MDVYYKTYAALFQTGHHLLDLAERCHEGKLQNLRAATVFFAFTFEAYLNHVGSEELIFWDDIERISSDGKLRVLSTHLGFSLKAQPFRTMKELSQLRNALAHGRTKKIKDSQSDKPLTFDAVPWERLNVKTVHKYQDDTRKALEVISAVRPQPDMNLMNPYKVSIPK